MARVIETSVTEEDIRIESTLRPQTLDDYIGQKKAKENLRVYIEAAKRRGDAWIMCFFTGLPAWERPRLRASSQMKWAST